MPAPLYIETRIRTHPDKLWQHTRDPGRHQRWDLRFTEISALTPEPDAGAAPEAGSGTDLGANPGADPADPGAAPRADPAPRSERFRYATRPFPGLTIAGTGTTVGERRRPDGTATSALRFASAHPLSPIRSGRGYWRYVPTPDGVRFLTGYDYDPGLGGRPLDRIVRPLMGWATAWSFDRLRLWLETGATPERTLRRALAETATRAAATAGIACLTRSPAFTALAAAACLLVPPLPGTPAARRCLRTPPDRRAATAPDALDRLETP